MIFRRVETREDLHGVDDLALLLGLLALLLLRALEIEEAALEDELFAADALIDARIVKLDHIVLQFDVMLSVIVEVLKVSQEGVGIRIIFLIEVATFGHVANDLMKIRDTRSACISATL